MRDLIDAAEAVRRQAYAPYSKFQVGCAIRSADGRIFTGANVENASLTLTLCAERSAVSAMIAAGAKEIAEVAICGSGPAPCVPCGGCRQVLNEFANPETAIHCYGQNDECQTLSLGTLLPHAFGPGDLL